MMDVLVSRAKEAGASNAFVLPVEKIPFDPTLRSLCVDNRCGKYNRNYGCPPFVGTPEEVIANAKTYEHALVLQTISGLEDSYDVEGMAEAGARHNRLTRGLYEQMASDYPACITLAAGGCTLCERCAILDGEKCRFPEKMHPCVESHGINVVPVLESRGLEFQFGANVVTWISLLFF